MARKQDPLLCYCLTTLEAHRLVRHVFDSARYFRSSYETVDSCFKHFLGQPQYIPAEILRRPNTTPSTRTPTADAAVQVSLLPPTREKETQYQVPPLTSLLAPSSVPRPPSAPSSESPALTARQRRRRRKRICDFHSSTAPYTVPKHPIPEAPIPRTASLRDPSYPSRTFREELNISGANVQVTFHNDPPKFLKPTDNSVHSFLPAPLANPGLPYPSGVPVILHQ